MIPEATVARIIEATDLVALISRYVPSLKKQGTDYKGLCPFHNEKSPSFTVSPTRGTAHCFGCGWHGDAIRFLWDHKQIDFPSAVKELAGPHGIHVEENAPPRRIDRDDYHYSDPDPAPVPRAAAPTPALEPEFRPRQRPRRNDDKPADFDWQKCVDDFDQEAVERTAAWRGYSIGFVEWLQREKHIGLYQGNIAFPVHDSIGNVVRCHYRRNDGGWGYFPKHGETAPWVIGDLADAGHVIAGESQWDQLALADKLNFHEDQRGLAFITTRGATSNTDFSIFKVPQIIAVPQNDADEKRSKKTGRTPAEDWLERIRETKAKDTRILIARIPPSWKDANDWIRDGKAPSTAVRKLVIETAKNPFLDGFKSARQLRSLDTSDDPNSLIGFKRRWLGRGGSFILIGPSGIGKSTLMILMAVHWAAGVPWFGISVRRPMKVLVVQAENDDGDVAEMLKSAFEALRIDLSAEELARAEDNLIFRHETERTGEAWCGWLDEAIRETGAELVFADPLLSYAGGDVSRQEVASGFLRNWLQPVLAKTGCILAFVHHTGKTSADPKSRAHWSESDGAYLGLGSSEITNWARSIATLVPASKDSTVFRFSIAKRGGRAGMRSKFCEGVVKSLFLAHAEVGSPGTELEFAL